MKCLLLAAHGGRMPQTNEEVRHLADEIRGRAGNRYQAVTCAFLQFGQPSVADAIESCIRDGATEIVVLPYLLAAGSHVAKDIPLLVKTAKVKHPDVNLVVTPHLGSAKAIADVILSLVP